MKLQLATLVCIVPFLIQSIVACNNQQSHTLDSMMGTADGNIVGGQQVKASDQISKHVVGIAFGNPKLSGIFCSGVLVKKNVIVTAAHCTDLGPNVSDAYVVFGLNLSERTETRKILGGKTTDKWPSLKEDDLLNTATEWGDIALLKFEGEAPSGFEPARILGDSSKLQKGMDVVIAGYGLTSYSPRVESDKLLMAVVKLSDPSYTASEILFDQYDGKGACKGDSGGPAFTTINNKLFLIGITSRAATNNEDNLCTSGSVYTNVSAQIPFLIETAKFLDSSAFQPGKAIPQPRL